MVSLLPTKFHEIVFSSFRGVALTTEAARQRNSSETTKQNFMKLCR
jgi:hypothetical protein